ncbi:MAG: hypothetical protein Q613_PSC00128G0001, partial [Propionibacterium sp. DORA_15]
MTTSLSHLDSAYSLIVDELHGS